jgi:cell division protein FtsB
MIFELKTLQNRIEPLRKRIEQLEEEKETLRKAARKKGIPPGYLRP